ncbi:MAG: ribonuclease R [Nannocystaceae bacterium]
MNKRKKQPTVAGEAVARLQVNPGGYGFAARLDGEGSVFIPNPNLGDALDGDEVSVRFWHAERGPEGAVESIVNRGRTRITGQLYQHGKAWSFAPDDPRLIIPVDLDPKNPGTLEVGKVVVARIVRYPDRSRRAMVVRVEQILGEPDTLATEVMKILIEQGIDPIFADEVANEGKQAPTEVRDVDLEGRADLRELPFMTIDPDDARDFDDAVCIELLGEDPGTDDMQIHVAVADVSHYVRIGTAIDREASIRGFSTYLPDRAIPMLPEELSSHICSLRPHEDRLAMVASMRLAPDGSTSDIQVRAAVIHSQRRLTYGQVAGELAGREKLPEEIRKRIKLLRRAADRLRSRRMVRGAIELNLPESRILLDEDDPERIRDIIPARSSRELTRAYNLIEEFMLAANEAVGELGVLHKLPLVYRVHDKPDETKLAQLAAAGEVLGVRVDPEKLVNPRGAQKFLGKVKTHERCQAFNNLMLRAMAQAAYSTDNLGHFALASPAYAHFTSPIRRYPDVLVHRVLKAWLAHSGKQAGPMPVPKMPKRRTSEAHAVRSSERERMSAQAERDARSLFAAAFMRDRIGDRFTGVVSGLTSSGMFVALEAPRVDGMIKLATLERSEREQYELDDTGVRLVGKRRGEVWMVGDRLVVEVVDASMQRRRVELAFISRLST